MQPVKPMVNCIFVLVNPGFSVSTKEIFETFALTKGCEASKLSRFRKQDVASLSLSDMVNDLESVTSQKFSEIEHMKSLLLDAGASRAMMSGSGPTVFGVFPDTESGLSVVHSVTEKLRLQYKDRVFITRSCAGAWPSG